MWAEYQVAQDQTGGFGARLHAGIPGEPRPTPEQREQPRGEGPRWGQPATRTQHQQQGLWRAPHQTAETLLFFNQRKKQMPKG